MDGNRQIIADEELRSLLTNNTQKIYKENRLSFTKMTPSDPKGLLDDLFSKRGGTLWKVH